MKLCIICVEEQFEVKRLKEEAEKRGHLVTVLSPKQFPLNKPIGFDALLFRAIQSQTKQAKLIAKKALKQGKTVVDEKLALGGGQDKFENYQLFKQAGLFVPETILLNKQAAVPLKNFSAQEIVVKRVSGKRGQGIYRLQKEELPKLLPKLIKDSKRKYTVQEFVEIKKDIRILVVGEKVLGAFYKKTSNWKHNISLGATPVKCSLAPRLKEAALKAKKLTGTEIAGIDIAITSRGLFVLEVNRAPGFKGFEKATGKNVAKKIIKYLEEKTSS